MNKIYKVVFNYATQTWAAVSEFAKGHSKSKTQKTASTLNTPNFTLKTVALAVSVSIAGGVQPMLGR